MEKNQELRLLPKGTELICLSLLADGPMLSQDFRAYLETNAIQGFDLAHQIGRLRNAKNMSDGEMDLIVRTLVERVRSYEQVVEVSRSVS